MVIEFLTDYGMSRLPDDEKIRSKMSVEKCILTILDFLQVFLEHNSRCNIRSSDLYQTIKIRNKYGQLVSKKIPIFANCYGRYYSRN